MKRKIKKRSVIIWLLILLVMVGCGNKDEVIEGNAVDYTYAVEYQIFHIGEYLPYLSSFNEDGTVCFACYGKNQTTQLFCLAPGQKEPKEISLKLESGTGVTSIGNDWNGNFLLACSRYDETLELLELKQLSPEGEVLNSVDMSEIFRNIPDFEAKCLAGDGSGNYYVGDRTKLYVIDSEGKLLYTLEMEANVENLLSSQENNRIWGRLSNGTLVEIHEGANTIQTIASDINFGYGIYAIGKEKELVYTQGDVLYACDTKDEVPIKILNWTDYDVNSSELQSITILEDGKIVSFSAQSAAGGECELVLLTRTLKENVPEKTVITYGCAYPSSLLCSQIVRFNKVNSQYRIELKQYGEDSMDLETIKNLIRMDIISGNGPDIIDIGALFSEEERYELIEAALLEDLNPYFEKDASICREDYLEKVLQVYERDNELYAIMPTFALYGLVGRESDIGESSSWTLEEMESFFNAHSNDAKIVQGISKDDMLDILCKLNMDKFVDKETGQCYFDGEKFKQVLEFSNHFDVEREIVNLEQTRNGEILLMEASLMSVVDFQRYEYMFAEPINLIGYPTNFENGIMALPCVSVLAMSRNTENKEGAWQFIRFILEENQQEELGESNFQGIPIKKSVIDKLCEKQMEEEFEEDETGNVKEKSKGSWSFQDYTIEYYAVTGDEADRFKELLQKIGNSMEKGSDYRLLEIVQEEAKTYFEGQKSLEDVAEIIQNRAQNYVNEKIQ